MPNTATFSNKFTAVFTPPRLGSQLQSLPLFTELDTVIETESSQGITVEGSAENVPILSARIGGLNTFIVSRGATT